jgi:hypothetical protein
VGVVVLDDARKFGAEVGQVFDVILGDVVFGHHDELLVALTAVDHAQHANGTAGDHDAVRDGFVDDEQGVERIAVFAQGLGQVAVVAG